MTSGVGSPPWWQRCQCLLQDDDVVASGVGAGVAGAQQPGQGLAAGDLGAVQERQQRVVAVGLLPGRGGTVLVVGVIDDQGGVDVDVQPSIRCGGGAGGPCRRTRGRSGRSHPR